MTATLPFGTYLYVRQAPKGRVRPEGLGRGEAVDGCGTPAVRTGLCTPLWCV